MPEHPETKPREELLRCFQEEEADLTDLPNRGSSAGYPFISVVGPGALGSASSVLSTVVSENWRQSVKAAVQSFAAAAATRSHVLARIDRLEKEVAGLRAATSVQAVICSLAPEPYELSKGIPVTIQGADDEWTATFFDANIAISGDTQEEAVDNLKGLIVDTLESLVEDEAILGPGPARQLATLRDFIQRRPGNG